MTDNDSSAEGNSSSNAVNDEGSTSSNNSNVGASSSNVENQNIISNGTADDVANNVLLQSSCSNISLPNASLNSPMCASTSSQSRSSTASQSPTWSNISSPNNASPLTPTSPTNEINPATASESSLSYFSVTASTMPPPLPPSRAKTLTVNAVSACMPRPVYPHGHLVRSTVSLGLPSQSLHHSLASNARQLSVEEISNVNKNIIRSSSMGSLNSAGCSNQMNDTQDKKGNSNDEFKCLTKVPSLGDHVALTRTNAISPDANNEIVNPMPPINTSPLLNWQESMTTVKERFAFLFNNEILSDVHFIVGRGESCQRIPAHKFVLSVGSAVFDAMFNGCLFTSQKEIELPDVEPQAFLSLLRFLYSDEVQIGPETVMAVLYTAKKYAVPALERHCDDFLKSNLASDNAFMLLSQARLFDKAHLAALCLDTIDKCTAESLDAEGFCDIDSSTLCLVLERDTLLIREAKLFQAIVKWSEAECERQGLSISSKNQRQVLCQALSLIRFPLMTVEEFAQGPAQSGILTDREVVELFLYFTVNPKPSVPFPDVPRCCMTGKEQKVCRFVQVESRWGYSGTSDRIRFVVDRKIFVVGFGMYGSIHGRSEYEVVIQILLTGTGKVCASNDTTFLADGTTNTFRVMFKEPVEIMPNTNYTAYATLRGPDSHYGTKGVRKITVACPSGDRVQFQFTFAAGNNNGTSVEDGQIPEIIFYT